MLLHGVAFPGLGGMVTSAHTETDMEARVAAVGGKPGTSGRRHRCPAPRGEGKMVSPGGVVGRAVNHDFCRRVSQPMSATAITVGATLQPDGRTLLLEKELALPPGQVTVTVRADGPKSGPAMLEVLERIHQDQQRRGHRPMTEEEMAAEIAKARAVDDEYEERWRQIWSRTGERPENTDNR